MSAGYIYNDTANFNFNGLRSGILAYLEVDIQFAYDQDLACFTILMAILIYFILEV